MAAAPKLADILPDTPCLDRLLDEHACRSYDTLRQRVLAHLMQPGGGEQTEGATTHTQDVIFPRDPSHSHLVSLCLLAIKDTEKKASRLAIIFARTLEECTYIVSSKSAEASEPAFCATSMIKAALTVVMGRPLMYCEDADKEKRNETAAFFNDRRYASLSQVQQACVQSRRDCGKMDTLGEIEYGICALVIGKMNRLLLVTLLSNLMRANVFGDL